MLQFTILTEVASKFEIKIFAKTTQHLFRDTKHFTLTAKIPRVVTPLPLGKTTILTKLACPKTFGVPRFFLRVARPQVATRIFGPPAPHSMMKTIGIGV